MRTSANFWWRDGEPNFDICRFSKIPLLPRVRTSKVDDASTWSVFVGMSIRSKIVIEICFRRLEWGARSPNHFFGGVEVRANPSE